MLTRGRKRWPKQRIDKVGFFVRGNWIPMSITCPYNSAGTGHIHPFSSAKARLDESDKQSLSALVPILMVFLFPVWLMG